MKRQLSVLAVAGLSLVGCASSQRLEVVPKPSQATVARFEAMKKLNGRWEAVTPMEGMSPVCEFKVIAGGSTIVETMFPGSTHEMINTYTINGDSIVATHYCALGNQPHMKLVGGSDTDFLFDQTWISAEAGGQVRPLANNGDLVLNLLDAMTGQAGLATLRGRGLVNRPFTVMETMQREAELKYRTREQELLDRIREAEAEIGEIEESGEGGVVLTPEQEAAIEGLRRELLEARRELREVQRGLRDDLETLVQRLQLANIAAVPAAVALIGLLVALLRRRRAQRGAVADGQVQD